MKKILVLLIFLLLQNIVIPQELGSPIIVSTLIGDKLDRIENEYFDKIFPSFEGFVEAEFYLNTDSSLTAKIIYEQDNLLKDSVIDNVHNLIRLQKYLINKVNRDIKTYNSDAEKIKIVLPDDTITSASLFSINENEVKIFNSKKGEALTFKNDEIKKIIRQEAASNSSYSITGLILGIPIGTLIGVALIDEEKESKSFVDVSSGLYKIFRGILGGLIGAAIGYLSGTAIDNSITVEEEFTANPEGCFCHLDEYTILSMSLSLK